MGAGAHHPARPRPLPRRPRAAARGVPQRPPGRRDRQLRPGRRPLPRRRRVRLGLGAGRLDPRLGRPARVDHGRAARRDRRPAPRPARPAGRLPERPLPALRAGQPQAPAAEHEHDPPAPARPRRPRPAGLRVGAQGGQPVRRDQGRPVRGLPRHPAVQVGARPRPQRPRAHRGRHRAQAAEGDRGLHRRAPAPSQREGARGLHGPERGDPAAQLPDGGDAQRAAQPAVPRRRPGRDRDPAAGLLGGAGRDHGRGGADAALARADRGLRARPDGPARPAGRSAQRARLGDLVPHDLGRADQDAAVGRTSTRRCGT